VIVWSQGRLSIVQVNHDVHVILIQYLRCGDLPLYSTNETSRLKSTVDRDAGCDFATRLEPGRRAGLTSTGAETTASDRLSDLAPSARLLRRHFDLLLLPVSTPPASLLLLTSIQAALDELNIFRTHVECVGRLSTATNTVSAFWTRASCTCHYSPLPCLPANSLSFLFSLISGSSLCLLHTSRHPMRRERTAA